MFIVAALQMFLIIIYRIIDNFFGEKILCKFNNITDKIVKCITRSHVQNKSQQIELKNIPPAVAYSYEEFIEPLVGHD